MRERIINHYWKLRRYYWKYKFVIRKAIITAIEAAATVKLPYRQGRSMLYWKARRGYDNSRVFVIRLFWKLKGIFDYVRGYGVGYFRHFTVIGYWKLHRFINFLKAESAGALAKTLKDSVIFYPIKKSYWFFSYQIQKRIFKKKTKID